MIDVAHEEDLFMIQSVQYMKHSKSFLVTQKFSHKILITCDKM